MGIPENVVTGCVECHDKCDFGINSDVMKENAIRHLKKFYNKWSEEKVKYKKMK